jgi:hypothetical protein
MEALQKHSKIRVLCDVTAAKFSFAATLQIFLLVRIFCLTFQTN